MNDRAFLVVHVDTTDHKNPKLVRAGIYSAAGSDLTNSCFGKEYALTVVYTSGETYQLAVDALWRLKEQYAGIFDWAFNLLPEVGRR